MTRFSIAIGAQGRREATLLVKCNSLLLKMLTKNCGFRLIFFKLPPENILLYGVEIDDEPAAPAFLWAIAERAEEVEAIKKVVNGEYSIIYLYNEVAVNVAWGEPIFEISQSLPSADFLEIVKLVKNGSEKLASRVRSFFDTSRASSHIRPNSVVILPRQKVYWNQIDATYITNSLQRSTFQILDANEGDQQEHLAVRLTDTLSLAGAHKGPIVHETKARELTDVLFAYSKGLFLIESKVASVFNDHDPPTREKLKRNTIKNIKKAINQHIGACRNVLKGTRITTKDGNDVNVPRDLPIHCIILIADSSMIADESEFGSSAIKKFHQKTNSFLHILDSDSLMGIVLNANKLSKESQSSSPIMAFDFILMKRWEQALNLDSAYFRFVVQTR